MRSITNESTNAFINGRAFKKANMKVEISATEKGMPCIISLLLHDNEIATLHTNERIKKLYISDAGWQTNTTKERLNGVLDAYNLPRLSQKKGVWYIGAEEFNGCKTFEL
jgi:hypothetical protein